MQYYFFFFTLFILDRLGIKYVFFSDEVRRWLHIPPHNTHHSPLLHIIYIVKYYCPLNRKVVRPTP